MKEEKTVKKWIDEPHYIYAKQGIFKPKKIIDAGYIICPCCRFTFIKEEINKFSFIGDYNYCPRCGEKLEMDATIVANSVKFL